jgi:hypothetical protein
METMSTIFEALGFAVFVFLFFILAIFLVNPTKTETLSESNTKIEEFKQEAVDNGFAKWVVNDKGEVTFEWIQNEGTE